MLVRHTTSLPTRVFGPARPRLIGTTGALVRQRKHRTASTAITTPSKISERGRVLAGGGAAAAAVWESVNALAARPGMINMGQGFPDYPPSAVARAAAAEAIVSGTAAMNQYSPQPGLLGLRESVARFYKRRYGTSYDPATEVVITAGGQESLAAAFLAFLDPGDEVILFEPFYPFMLGAVRLAGAIPKVITLKAPTFAIDADELSAVLAASPKAKALVLNTPHNPTGRMASPTELDAVARACQEHDLIAIADEVYENAVFEGGEHLRLADRPGMAERTISVSSGGKLFSLTGWRVAWALGPAALVQPLCTAHTHLTFSAPTPLQAGVAAALDVEDGLAETGPLFGGNFDMLKAALLEGTSVTRVCAAQGGYFLVAETDGRSDAEFCAALAAEHGVVCTPMSVFYHTPFPEDAPCTLVRFTVCKSRAHIERACSALRSRERGIGEGARQ